MKHSITGLVVASLIALSPIAYSDPTTDMSQISQQQFEIININQAGIEQLIRLKGIGEKKAKAIIEFRQKHGDFSSFEDLLNVKGIGDNVIKENIDRVIF